jgi:FkbM family methyltransferase
LEVSAVLAGALSVVGWLFYRCLQENGRNLLRIEALERSQKVPATQQFVYPLEVHDDHERGILHNVVRKDEYRIADQRFEPGDVIVDVGANIGAFSYLCHTLGSRAIFGYEPSARNFRLLEQNLGSRPGVHLFHAAVWRSDCDYPVQLFLSEGPNSGSDSVLAAGHWVYFECQRLGEAVAGPRPTESISLDAILERFSRVKLLKLDCEGSEFPILLTSRCLDRVDRIVAEVHEQEPEVFSQLDPRSRVDGYTAYRSLALVSKLEAAGFHVTTRPGGTHMCLLEARRIAPQGQGISSIGMRS